MVTTKKIQRFLQLIQNRVWENEPTEHFSITSAVDSDSLSPWHFWTLICFARHHVRQNWVADIVKYRLSGDLDALAGIGALGHPDIPQSGLVPQDIEWEYYFHGRGCCLTHRGTGEAIDVDFFDATGDYFSLWFYKSYLKSLKNPELPEKRLIELHPSIDSIDVSAEELFESFAFEKHPDGSVSKLSAEVVKCLPGIEVLCERMEDRNKFRAIATAANDWLKVRELSSSASIQEQQKLEKCVENLVGCRLESLGQRFEQSDSNREILAAIYDTSPLYAEAFLLKSLSLPPSGVISLALELIEQSENPKWCEPVFQLFRRVSPNRDLPEPHLWAASASILLKNGYQTDFVLLQFERVKNRQSAEAAMLALEYSPSQAKGLFRIALRSPIPHERIIASAALAVIDRSWSRKELIQILSESNDQQMTLYARAALFASPNPEDHSIVEHWEIKNPRNAETGKYISFDEASVRSRDATVCYYMQKLHNRLWPLRETEVP